MIDDCRTGDDGEKSLDTKFQESHTPRNPAAPMEQIQQLMGEAAYTFPRVC